MLLFGVALGVQATSTHVASIHIESAQVVGIEGKGFTPPPQDVDAASLTDHWEEVTLPFAPQIKLMARSETSRDAVPLTITHWYRMQLPGLEHTEPPHHLYIPRWKSDGQIAVYANGHLIFQNHANLQWNGSNLPLWIALPPSADGRPLREILVRIQHLQGIGGALSSLWAGSREALHWRYLVRQWLQADLPAMSSSAFLALGIFSCFVWLKRRHELLYFLFFVIAVAAYLRTMHYYAGRELLPFTDEWFGWVTVNSACWLMTAAHLFLVQLHQRRQAWLTLTLVGVTLVIGMMTLPAIPWFLDATIVAPWVYFLMLPIGGTTFVIGLRNAIRSGSSDAILLAGWSLFSLALGGYDWLLQNNFVSIEGFFLGAYGNVGVFYIFTYIMLRRYVEATRQVELANANLASRLQEREDELQESYQRLREAERKETLRLERQRLTQDMHDGLGSSLVSALRVIEQGTLGEEEIADVLRGCIDDLKLTIDSMESIDPDLMLLLATLRFRLAPRLERTGIILLWEVQDIPSLTWLTPRHSLHILRILQEAFTNIIKHSRAAKVTVSTAAEGDDVVVTIADNGEGFDVALAMESRGKGLKNQQRRADAIGARVTCESNCSGCGTHFRLRLPIRTQASVPVAQ